MDVTAAQQRICFVEIIVRKVTFFLMLILSSLGFAQQSGELAKYSVQSAAYSTLMTYCATKFGPIHGESAGAQCFRRGQKELAKMNLANAIRQMEAKCPNTATFSTCMTPHLASTVLGILGIFEANGV